MLDVKLIRDDPEPFRRALARRDLASPRRRAARRRRAAPGAHRARRGAARGAEPGVEGDRARAGRREAGADRRGRGGLRRAEGARAAADGRRTRRSPRCWPPRRTSRTRAPPTGGPTRTRSRSAATTSRRRTWTSSRRTTWRSGELLGVLDIERGARTSGSRFVYLLGDIVLLQFALVRSAIDILVEQGLHAGDPAGARARGGDVRHGVPARPTRRRSTRRAEDDLYLVGHLGGPARRAAHGRDPRRRPSCRCATPATRPASAARPAPHGKDTRGIFRVHQFDKVEMFSFVEPEDSLGRARAPASASRRRSSATSSCPTGW